MGRRGKTESLGTGERILHLYNVEHRTIEEIAAIFEAEEIPQGRESIRRFVRSSKEAAADFQAAVAEAKILIDTVRENPNTDVIEATTALLSRKLFEHTKSIEDLGEMDITELSNAISKTAIAQEKLSRLRLSYQTGFEAAKKAVLAALKGQLQDHPDLLERLAAVIRDIPAEGT